MCFYNLTNTYFSILPAEFEKNLKEEIWGCFKYIGIPIDTVMNMPIQDRKYFIMKHNADEAELKAEIEGDGGESHTIEGEALNMRKLHRMTRSGKMMTCSKNCTSFFFRKIMSGYL